MSTVPPEVPNPVPIDDVPSTLTVTFYQQLAARVTAALDEVSAILPPLTGDELLTPRRPRNVPRVFLETAVSSVERNPELQAVRKLNVPAARDTLQCLEAFRPVLDAALGFINRLTLALQSRQGVLTAEALQIYDVAKGLARDLKSPDLITAVANLKRDLGRRGPAPVSASVRKAAKIAGAAARASVIAAATAEGKAA